MNIDSSVLELVLSASHNRLSRPKSITDGGISWIARVSVSKGIASCLVIVEKDFIGETVELVCPPDLILIDKPASPGIVGCQCWPSDLHLSVISLSENNADNTRGLRRLSLYLSSSRLRNSVPKALCIISRYSYLNRIVENICIGSSQSLDLN
jgi:hypothetical protein